jgi:hypothetical protein
MDKKEALMESKLDLASNGEISTPFEDETYPSIEEALDEPTQESPIQVKF